MIKLCTTALGLAALLAVVSGDVRAGEFRLSAEQLDQVTAAGGQIASIGPARAKAATVKPPKGGIQLLGGQIASI